MTIVTVADGDERAGCMVGFTSQCSIEPARFVACISKKNHTHDIAMRAQAAAVHFVDQRHRSLAELFGGETGDEIDKFARCQWHPGPDGVPLLDGCERWFVGRVVDRVAFGDHTGLVLEPLAAHNGPAGPPLTLDEAQPEIDPGHPA